MNAKGELYYIAKASFVILVFLRAFVVKKRVLFARVTSTI